MRVELRERRIALGLTQLELAAAADVSRQLVAAVEAGVNAPAADAAVRLARALECTVEELFAPLGEGERSAAVEPGALVVAGCDPVLMLAERMLTGSARDGARAGSQATAPVVAIDATSGAALASLRTGAIHAAIVHGPPGALGESPAGCVRVQLARWQVGLGLAPGLKAGSLADLLGSPAPIVQRQESASSQQALRRAAQRLGHRELPAGAVAAGHRDAARAAAALGCAAVTTEGAAQACGLRFVALEQHTVELWLAGHWREHAGFLALLDLLSSRAFRSRVTRLGGYDLGGCGTLLTSPGTGEPPAAS